MENSITFREYMAKWDAEEAARRAMRPKARPYARHPNPVPFRPEMTLKEFTRREVSRKDVRRARIYGRGKADRMNEVRERERERQALEAALTVT